MRGMKDPRLQRMIAGAFLLVGVFLTVISGPEVLSRPFWTEQFWTEQATVDAGIFFVIGLSCIAGSLQVFAQANSR